MKFRHLPGWLHDERKAHYLKTRTKHGGITRQSPIVRLRDYHQSVGIGYFSIVEPVVPSIHGSAVSSVPSVLVGDRVAAANGSGEAGVHVVPLQEPELQAVCRDAEPRGISGNESKWEMNTENYIRRLLAFHKVEIEYLQERRGFWRNKFQNEPSKQMAAIRGLQRSIMSHEQALAYWQGYLADWSQS